MITAKEVLARVLNILGERENNYNNPAPNFQAIADSYTPVLLTAHPEIPRDTKLTTMDIARFMVIIKMVRDAHKVGIDNWDDTIGYGVCGRRILDGILEEQHDSTQPTPLVSDDNRSGTV